MNHDHLVGLAIGAVGSPLVILLGVWLKLRLEEWWSAPELPPSAVQRYFSEKRGANDDR